jgi:hypothetical protein
VMQAAKFLGMTALEAEGAATLVLASEFVT